MIGRLNHVAIAVRDIDAATRVYRDTLAAQVSDKVPQPAHGVTTVFVTLPNTKIELLEPLGDGSPIARFLERHPDGGIPHLCYVAWFVYDAGVGRNAWLGRRRTGSGRRSETNIGTLKDWCCSYIPRISAVRWLSLSKRERSCLGRPSPRSISSCGGPYCSRSCPGACVLRVRPARLRLERTLAPRAFRHAEKSLFGRR